MYDTALKNDLSIFFQVPPKLRWKANVYTASSASNIAWNGFLMKIENIFRKTGLLWWLGWRATWSGLCSFLFRENLTLSLNKKIWLIGLRPFWLSRSSTIIVAATSWSKSGKDIELASVVKSKPQLPELKLSSITFRMKRNLNKTSTKWGAD